MGSELLITDDWLTQDCFRLNKMPLDFLLNIFVFFLNKYIKKMFGDIVAIAIKFFQFTPHPAPPKQKTLSSMREETDSNHVLSIAKHVLFGSEKKQARDSQLLPALAHNFTKVPNCYAYMLTVYYRSLVRFQVE